MRTKELIYLKRQIAKRISPTDIQNKMLKHLKIDKYNAEMNMEIKRFNQTYIYDDLCNWNVLDLSTRVICNTNIVTLFIHMKSNKNPIVHMYNLK